MQPTRSSKKEEQVMERKQRPLSPSVLEGSHPLSIEIESSSFPIKGGGITTRKVRHYLIEKKTDFFTLKIPRSNLGIGEAAGAPCLVCFAGTCWQVNAKMTP